MPTYRSITLSLVSQYDILTIPEFPPPPSALPAALTSLVQTYIPTYPSSQFWLTYSIAGPHPPGLLYYFKLFLNGAHVISWGVGEEERFRGKTVFALFDAGDGLWSAAGRRTRLLEKRAFCFGPDGDDEGAMEVRVFRAGGRKKERISSAVRPMQEVRGEMMSGISLIPSGLAPDTAPKRYYKYALIDPLDAPFATFRYLYRSWEKLESLGVPLETHASAASSSGTSSLTSTITASVDEEEANRARTPSPPRHFGAGGGPTPSPFGDTRRGRSPEMSTSKTTDRSSSRSKPRVSALRDVVASAVRRRQLRRRGMDEERSEREREVREREGGEISPLRL
ncbi:MAG: hypothetical protein M1832_004647 [Thelocarpon impressellum]|nr:MAG: hypothetical protein M1832_004647 [Thelocarpon impressellum]